MVAKAMQVTMETAEALPASLFALLGGVTMKPRAPQTPRTPRAPRPMSYPAPRAGAASSRSKSARESRVMTARPQTTAAAPVELANPPLVDLRAFRGSKKDNGASVPAQLCSALGTARY